MKHRPTLLDFGLLIFISFVWGSSFLAIKIGLRAFDPFSLAATRVFIAGFFMYLVARLRGEIFPTDKTILKQLALIGLFGSSAFMLISWGQQYISTSTAGIMLAFGPLNLLFLAHFMTEDEKLSIPKLIGFGFGFAGVALLFSGAGLANIETEGFGMVAMFVASIAYALSMIFV
ncbi:MAG: EamA family transporter, partial [Sphingomonadales bacterium]